MCETKLIKIEHLTSKAGNPFSIAWVTLPNGLPAKICLFGDKGVNLRDGQIVHLTFDVNQNCEAKVSIQEA